MNYKVEQYIKQSKFTNSQLPVTECYKDATEREENFFNEEEQKQLFDYFLEKRKEGLLYYFSRIDNTIAEIPIFYKIKDYIRDKILDEINNIKEEPKLTINQYFNFLDYINSLSKALPKEKIQEYWFLSFAKLETIKVKDIKLEATEKGMLQNSLNFIVEILINSNIDITEEIIDKLLFIKNIIPKEFYNKLSYSFITLISKYQSIDKVLYPITDFILENIYWYI